MARGVSFVPGADPAGRATLNSPVTYTRFPTMTCAHTTPFVCTVGSTSAETVSGTSGAVGAVSSRATGGRTESCTRVATRATTVNAANERDPTRELAVVSTVLVAAILQDRHTAGSTLRIAPIGVVGAD